jgi:hypothetical protein
MAGDALGNDGTGEPSRAIDCARGTEAAGELWPESREELGTALGFDDSPAMIMCVYGKREVGCSGAACKANRELQNELRRRR